MSSDREDMKIKKEIIIIVLVIVVILAGASAYVLNTPSSSNSSASNSQVNLSDHLSPTDFKNAMDSGKYKLIDVRTIAEFNTGHLKGASESDFYQTKDFNTYLNSLDKYGKYLIYCHTGNRSGQTIQMMQEKGFTDVHDLTGGVNNWIANGLPVVK